MARKPQGPALLTANDLLSGVIVYWTGTGWSRDIDAATRANTDEARMALEAAGRAAEDANTVVGAYLITLDASGAPAALRERRRLAGPLAA